MNAIESMSSETGHERRLTVASGVDEKAYVRITVEDTGSGIDPANLNRIFDPFFTTKSDGMGFGLSICRSMVEAHGGRLWVLPRTPYGAVFHLTLPSAAA
jgi:two-component system, LuxR family, sensor kinase FixL